MRSKMLNSMKWLSGMSTLLIAVVGAVSCSDITTASGSDVVEIQDLDNAQGAVALRAGAIALFTDAYAGNEFGRNHITMSGAVADEVFAGHPNEQADQRDFSDPPFGSPYLYAAVQEARVNLLVAISGLQRFAPDPPDQIGELFSLAGYTILFLGEAMCAGVPLSRVADDGQLIFGEPNTREQIFEAAAAQFDSALAYSGNNINLRSLARVGQARALLNNARFAEAVATVADVPISFAYRTHHSGTTQQNGVHRAFYISLFVTVADGEGGNGLDFVSAGDPRVQTEITGEGSDGTTIYAPTKYPDVSSQVVLAGGTEARLIEAEALLSAGDAAGALVILNQLRANAADLAPLPLEVSETAQVDQLFRERAFWLFLTGTRQGDLRRLIRQYGRDSEQVFPTGAYKGTASYGDDVNFPPDEREYSNPHYNGCLNRDP